MQYVVPLSRSRETALQQYYSDISAYILQSHGDLRTVGGRLGNRQRQVYNVALIFISNIIIVLIAL
jgi:hypothetical protein